MAAVGGCRHVKTTQYYNILLIKKSLFTLWDKHTHDDELYSVGLCKIFPYARLDFIQSGFFAFTAKIFSIWYYLLCQKSIFGLSSYVKGDKHITRLCGRERG